jgi:polyhydroxyalkanoate synthesis regulator phasin
MAGPEMDEALAEALGIDVDQLQAARESAFDRLVQEAVAEGELGSRQAERMQAWRKLRPYLQPESLVARALEMTPDQLRAALDQGQSLWDLAEEHDLDFDSARDRLMAAGKEAVQQAVADGAISQDQAEEAFKLAGRGRRFARRGFGPMGFGGRGRCGPGRGWGGWWQGEAEDRTTLPDVI